MTRAPGFLSVLFAMTCAAAVAVLVSSCGSKSGGVDVDDEDTYPSSVADLRVRSVTPSTVTLEWTAPGDDDTVGTAALYDIRYSRREITWQNWDSASVLPLSGEPKPSPAGSTDTMRVTGLMADSTYCFALKTRGTSGSWSWLSNCASAVCFNDIEVTFPDPHLDEIIRAAIGKPTGAIHRSELLPIIFIDANNRSVADLSGLEYCINLEGIFLWNNSVSDLAPLAELTKLRSIQAGENDIADISALAGLVNLEQLILNDNTISDISSMSAMSKLADVSLAGNAITSVAALAGKPAMTNLILERNGISDVGPLSGMTNLTALNLSTNHVASVAALSGMTKLKQLYLYDNSVTDISALSALVNLETLNLWKNGISNIAPLSGLTKLKELFLSQNQINSIAVLSNLTLLERLYLGNNPIADASPLAGLTSLTELNLQWCQVVDVTPLQGLVNLQKLVLYYNQVVDIAPLVANSGLGTGDLLYLGGNPLSQQSLNTYVPALTARGVVVYL